MARITTRAAYNVRYSYSAKQLVFCWMYAQPCTFKYSVQQLHLRNDLYCVGWSVINSTHSLTPVNSMSPTSLRLGLCGS